MNGSIFSRCLLFLLCISCGQAELTNLPTETVGGENPKQVKELGKQKTPGDPESQNLEVIFPPSEGNDIASEVSNFRSLKKCVKNLKIPHSLAGLLNDVGYRQAARDSCRTIEAISEGSSKGCEKLSISAARKSCQRRYAMFHGDPDLCPHIGEYGGRDPMCVAVSMRDPSLCFAEAEQHRIGLCRAIILKNARPCRVAHKSLQAAQACAGSAGRWWKVIPANRRRQSLPFGFTSKLTICESDENCLENPFLLKRGLILSHSQGLVIGQRYDIPIGNRHPIIEISVPIPNQVLPQVFDIGVSTGVHGWIALNPEGLFIEGTEISEGQIELERFEPRRGAIVAGSYTFVVEGKTIRGEFQTFIRDVIDL